jgi:UDP-glucose 4-epimerase
MPRVLVTGAAGFIGSHVADHCLRAGFEVVATDDLSGGFRDNVPAAARFVAGDLRDAGFVARLYRDHGPYDFVYHLAAYAAEGLSHFVRRYNYQTNLIASINLINESVRGGVARFVFTSSSAVYGASPLPMTEASAPAPEDPYGISKYAVELDLRAAREMFGLDYVVFRPHNVYGERQNIADRYRNVIGIFMSQILSGQPMSIFGDGTQTRAFSYIDDVAPIIARSPLVPAAANQVFNIGADAPYSILALARQVAVAFAVPCRVDHLPARNEAAHVVSDHTKVRQVFAPPPTVDLATGIEKMAAWVKAQGRRPAIAFGDLEIDKNLPPSWT